MVLFYETEYFKFVGHEVKHMQHARMARLHSEKNVVLRTRTEEHIVSVCSQRDLIALAQKKLFCPIRAKDNSPAELKPASSNMMSH